MKPPIRYKAVIFDLDGTLADTLEDIAGSMNRVLKAHRFNQRPLDDYRLLVGRGLENLVTQALPAEARTPDLIKICHSEMIRDYDKNCLVKTQLYPGIGSLLEDLVKKGIPLAVFSNKAEPLTLKIVKKLMGLVPFVSIRGARPDVPKKPDPAVALMITNKFGTRPGETIYAGDSDVDMQTASRAGMFPVGVSWGFRSRQELLENGAAVIIDKPADLLMYF